MKLEEAYAIVEEQQRLYKIKEYGNMANELEDASKKLKLDVARIKGIIESGQKSDIRWKDMAYTGYRNLFTKGYEFKENCLEILKKRKEYDQASSSPRAKFYAERYGVASDALISTASKGVKFYSEVYANVKELTRLIRLGQKLGLLKINIPSVEFRQPIVEDENVESNKRNIL